MRHGAGARITTIALFLVFGGLGVRAQDTPPSTVYWLGAGSTYQHGCFPPCMCPMMETAPIKGTFRLTFQQQDPLYDNYAVDDVHWTAPAGSGEHVITGSGAYRIGGEVALTHELALDLQVDQNSVEHFDSGLVAGGGNFPTIEITISIHGGFCVDTVIELHAKPTTKLSLTDTAVSWEPLSAATGYDLVRGDLGVLRATRGDFTAATAECLGNDSTASSLSYEAVPEPGQGFWFAVRGVASTGAGTYDEGSAHQVGWRDAEIGAAAGSCP